MTNLKFIKNLIKYEISLEEDVFDKEEVIEKYLYGKCDHLVKLLFCLNDRNGKRIEIIDENETIHYVYRDIEDDCFYDINGRFEDIDELVNKAGIFCYSGYGASENMKIRTVSFSDYELEDLDLLDEEVESIKGVLK